MENITEEQFMNMSDDERVEYFSRFNIMGADMNNSSELDHSSYEEIERLQYNAYFEDTILKEMNLKEKEYTLDPEESNEMFKQMIPVDWLKEDIDINTESGHRMTTMFTDTFYEDIKYINTILWKVLMNVDINVILKEYDEKNLDDVLELYMDMGKYHVIENAFHKVFNGNDDMITRIVLVAKLHDLEQIFHTLYRAGKIIKLKENKK